MLKLDLSKLNFFLPSDYLADREEDLSRAASMLAEHNGPGGDFTGWVTLPRDYDKEEFARIQAAAQRIRQQSQVLVVIGIGGSYLGARAAIEFLGHSFYNVLDKRVRKTPEIYFCGNSISSTYLKHLMDDVGDWPFSLNIIFK